MKICLKQILFDVANFRLYAWPPPPQDEYEEKNQSILELYANAQKRFNEKNKVRSSQNFKMKYNNHHKVPNG